MEKRSSERITVNLKAERISGDEVHSTFIENISEAGLQIMTAPAEKGSVLIPGTMVQLKLGLSTGETLDLHCQVVWADTPPPDDLTNRVGMKIITAPSRYREFVQSLG